MKHIIFNFLMACFATTVYADCDFKHSNYLQELKNPRSLTSISVDVRKSGKYARNAFKILASDSRTIPTALKKTFNATVVAEYKFGKCHFEATIKQSGDIKDHLDFLEGGKLISSLNVSLKSGNILNSVKFKLLIPRTRNDLHEVLGTIFLRELGFIAPETFQVFTRINGVGSTMIFQENLSKELIERNYRREGPIFEGDESLLFHFNGEHVEYQYEPLSLARMKNKSWFTRGESSVEISLRAFERLQNAYLRFAQLGREVPNSYSWQRLIIDPNSKPGDIFDEYYFVLLAMNGDHGLIRHNRRFFYNSLLDEFEPIYYDGNLKLDKKIITAKPSFAALKAYNENIQLFNKYNSVEFSEDLLRQFKNRVLLDDKSATTFFMRSKDIVEENFKSLFQITTKLPNKILNSFDYGKEIDAFLAFKEQHEVNHIVFEDFEKRGETYLLRDVQGNQYELSNKEFAGVISQNNLKGKRAIFLANRGAEKHVNSTKPFKVSNLLGHISRSNGIKLEVKPDLKVLSFHQTNPTDWVLLKKANLEGWNIKFYGVEPSEPKISPLEVNSQRFNQYGLTGCLNIVGSWFNKTKVEIYSSYCEDGLNIVSSDGNLSEIKVFNSGSDAFDADFSDLKVNSVIVDGAGNDCVDLSSGTYTFKKVEVFNCRDKGVSIGEMSNVNVDNFISKKSNIGLSTKDYSVANFDDVQIFKASLCYEVRQKKQEFGGALLNIGNLKCSGSFFVGPNSTAKVGRR